ncbi:hypothetical protein HPB50_008678 [Hyalomma asiaticum]|uniref:Uncharacterized protein n=1 Tax=Hyalomma asiaticum TaxID=266040 RepID=A0ACB7RIG9_HYAAI|nr:hypothetical protein HPB50_008678 [Hyalomma asiaticum]
MTSRRDAATAKKKSAAPSGVGTSTSLLPTVQPRSPTLDGEDRLQYEDAIPGPQDVAFSQTARPAQPVETRGTSFGRPVQPTDSKGENFSSLATGPQGLQHSVQPSSIDQVDGILHDPVATAIAHTFAKNSTGNENPNVTKAALDHFRSGEAPRRAEARRKARTTVSSGSLAAKPHPPGRHPVRDGHDYAAGMHPGMKTNTKHKHVDRVTHPHDARAPADGPTAGTTIPNNTGLEQPSAASTALTNSGGHSGHEQVVQQTSDTAADPSSHNAGVNRDRDPIGGADIATAGPHPSAETRGPPDVPGTTVLPRTTARTMALPPVGDPRHSLGTRSPTTDAKGRRTATGVTKKPKAKAQGYASPYGSLESAASVSPMWGTPVSTTNQLTTPALMTPDVMTPASSTPASPSPVMLATSDGPTNAAGAAVVHPPKPELDKAGRRPQESRKSREQHSPNLAVRAPAAPSGERRDKIKKASRATGNVRDRKTKKEVIAARSGTSKETLSPKGIISACSSKELLGHGAVATVSSQSKAGIVSVAEPMLREKDRDLDRPLECAKNLAVSSSQSESPKSQELHPSERAEGFKTASHGKNGAASVDMLVFQPHESQLVVSVSPMSGTPLTTPTKTVTSQRTSLLRKASWPLRELRKFRLDSRSLASSPPLHSMSMQTLLPESMGDRSQWLVVVVVAFVVSGMLLALLSRWALVKKKQPSDLCFSPACLRYASHILLQVNRSLDPCQDFSAYACSAWNPPVARADYAITSTTQLIRAWFEGFRGLLQEASERGFTVANGPAAMLRACLSHATNPGVPGIQELRDLMASIHLRWPDPPEDGVSPIGVILRLSYVWGVRR